LKITRVNYVTTVLLLIRNSSNLECQINRLIFRGYQGQAG